jgi:hypothetical protein
MATDHLDAITVLWMAPDVICTFIRHPAPPTFEGRIARNGQPLESAFFQRDDAAADFAIKRRNAALTPDR